MMLRLAILCLLTSSPALAAPWLGGPDAVDTDDAIADGPEDTAPAEPDEQAEDVAVLDLGAFTGSWEDGVRRVVVDGADPLEALPVEVATVPDTTAAELRGLLTGSGAKEVKLHGLVVSIVLWDASKPVHAVQATWLPSARSVLLAMAPTDKPASPSGVALPGGLRRNWAAAEKSLTRTLQGGDCRTLPVASNAALATLVPLPFIDGARQARDKAAIARNDLCAIAGGATWDRLELRLDALHFNLFDESGALRGGLRLTTDPAAGTFAYPMFKKLAK